MVLSEWIYVWVYDQIPLSGYGLLLVTLILIHPVSSFSFATDNDTGKRLWTAKLGSIDFTLAYILVLDAQGSSEGWNSQYLSDLPNPGSFIDLVQHFSGWLVWGTSAETPLYVFGHSTEIALSLLRHGQYNAVEVRFPFFYALSRQAVIILFNVWLNLVILLHLHLLVIEFAHDLGCPLEKWEVICKLSKQWWPVVCAPSSSRMFTSCSGSMWTMWNFKGEKSLWSHEMLL